MQSSPKRGSLLVIFLTVFIDLLGFGMVLPLLPIYAKQFGHDESGVMLALLMSSFSIMQFFFAPLWGRLSDRIGRRPVLMIGLAGSVVFYTLFGVATVMQSLTLLFVSRIGAGLAGATISTAHAYIADTTSLENRPKGMALIGLAFGLGFTLGPLFGALAVPWDSMNAAAETAAQTVQLGPWPGYAAAILSAGALLLAIFVLPESLHAQSESAARKRFSSEALREAISVPSIGLILMTIFIVVFSFSNLETTLSLVLKEQFQLTLRDVLLTFAFIGFVLALVQGGLVRPLSGRVNEAVLAGSGAALQIFAFGWIIHLLGLPPEERGMGSAYGVLAICTAGFAFVTPSLNSLLSRRSDPTKQGGAMGMGQSMSSLARIIGSGLGIYLYEGVSHRMPYYVAGGLMLVGLVMIIVVGVRGKDYGEQSPKPAGETAT